MHFPTLAAYFVFFFHGGPDEKLWWAGCGSQAVIYLKNSYDKAFPGLYHVKLLRVG